MELNQEQKNLVNNDTSSIKPILEKNSTITKNNSKFPVWLKIGFWCFMIVIIPILIYSLLIFILENPKFFPNSIYITSGMLIFTLSIILNSMGIGPGEGGLGLPRESDYLPISAWAIPFIPLLIGVIVGGIIYINKRSKFWLVSILLTIGLILFILFRDLIFRLYYSLLF